MTKHKIADAAREPHYAVIDEARFRDLVAGRPITMRTSVGIELKLILDDISTKRMAAAIADAVAASYPGPAAVSLFGQRVRVNPRPEDFDPEWEDC